MDRHPLWWTVGGTAGVAGAGLLAWWAQRRYDRGLAELVPAVQRPEPWVVDRPAEVDQIVSALRRRRVGTVGITTAVQGAGGFGKTTVAKMVRADRRVLRRFRGRVYWVTLGRDAGREALPGLVNGLIAQLAPDRPVTFTDAGQAADHLAAILAKGPGRLLVLDDVWAEEQLAAFPVVGRCARLVTTRVPSLAGPAAVPVRVDQMSPAQALALLQDGLPPLPPVMAAGLVEEAGRWPLLLRLVNKVLAGQALLGPDAGQAAAALLRQLRAGGALVVDELTGAAGRQLDVADPAQRGKAVKATIEASTGLLSPADRDRLGELAVFAEDEAIPIPLAAALWQATGSLDELAARALCGRLAGLALITPAPGETITMHDVIRDYLRQELGPARLRRLHQVLLGAIATGLPAAAAATGPGMVTAWWELPAGARYSREHLIEHMLAAGRTAQAEQAATDLRWAQARLLASGPASPYADLALAGTPRAARLRRVLGQAAHLLAPTEPGYSLADIFYSRVTSDPDWGPQARALAAARTVPALAPAWPLPDLPRPQARRTLAGHADWVGAVAIAPDGTWLATTSHDGTARTWDAATGQCRATLTGHNRPVTAVAIAPDGTWLATASNDDTARTWDAATGQCRATLTGHDGPVGAVAVAPDGTWLATASNNHTARTWDAATGQYRATLTGHDGRVDAVAIAPDGTWLATTSSDGTARTWDAATGQCRATLTGHDSSVGAVAIAPDGTWLATASNNHTARTWDAATGQCRATLTGHDGPVGAVAFAPDGTWLATTSHDGTARTWDAATGRCRAILTGHDGSVTAVAIAPDGTWLATTSGEDGTARTWDAATGQCRATLTGHDGRVGALAVAPDGTWLATTSGRTARVWDAVTGRCRATLAGHDGWVDAVAIAPDGTWLATTSHDDTARVWDAATGQCRATLAGHDSWVDAVAIAPDGTWLATTSNDGTARVWDAATGQCRATLTGHDGPVGAVAVAPDGTWLATASRDRTARIWDPATGAVGAVMRADSGLEGCAWSPDGRLLAVVGDAGLYVFAFSS
jgi:WD40 repeat protein